MRAIVLGALALLSSCRGPGTRQVMCLEGYTDCNGECVDLQNDPKHCGACSNACQSNQVCSHGACEPICASGMHGCGGVCVTNLALETCGTSCTPCPVVANGVTFCDGFSCRVICDPSLRACGAACAMCPAGVSVTCSGNTCVSSGCPAGQHLCNGQCIDEGPGSCGDRCLNCPMAPASGFQVCLNGGCEYLCRQGYRFCGTGCCPSDFVEVGADHSCMVTPAGAVQCWGRNHLDLMRGGALGDGSLLDRTQPFQVTGLSSGMVAVQPGGFHTCALNQFGAVQCWGWAEGGRLGDGTTSDKLSPMAVTGLGPGSAIAISAGGSGGCALSRGGEARCWGENSHGEVGDGTRSPRLTPVLVADLGTSVVDVSFGGTHACALMRGGTVRCWGDNAKGQLGDGTQDERTRPVLVRDLLDAVRISAGERHTCAVRKGGELRCWGDDADGQLGRLTGLTGATEVSAGGAHTCALFGAGQIQCWGANGSGQLGDGTTTGRAAAAPVSSISDGTSISAGRAHTCARTRSGTRCWGNNEFGQVGDGSVMNRLMPVVVN